ncbi:hypothetical protein [Roseimaritima sediminicola]|uniref:hypothetical protein n=1 Tax=Roseimaritima sediminicola TaxID=2662066 RepID=UPI00192A30F8|nr:hypothetical protein [Roseimaritima sediminicola]
MLKKLFCLTVLAAAAVASDSSPAHAFDPYAVTHVWSHNFAQTRPWHGGYQHIEYGQPLALVVPPTAHMRQTYSWGVSQNLMYPLHHQYGRSNPGYGYAPAAGFQNTPAWPSHTDQFGVYYVRGPW